MLPVIMLGVVMLSVIMLGVVMLSVIMLSAVPPFLSPGASSSGWTRTLELVKTRRVFYHCATATYSKNTAGFDGGNGTARFKKCKQLFEYQHLLLLRDI
jgi:hypothetical protein